VSSASSGLVVVGQSDVVSAGRRSIDRANARDVAALAS
jgi:hypothetical protein